MTASKLEFLIKNPEYNKIEVFRGMSVGADVYYKEDAAFIITSLHGKAIKVSIKRAEQLKETWRAQGATVETFKQQ